MDPEATSDTRDLLELFNSGQISHAEYRRRQPMHEAREYVRRGMTISNSEATRLRVEQYLQSDDGRAEVARVAREMLGLDIARTMAAYASTPTIPFSWLQGSTAPLRRIEPMQQVAVPGRIESLDDGSFRITPIAPGPSDDINALMIQMNQAWTNAYPAYVTAPPEPDSGFARGLADTAYRYAMGEVVGRPPAPGIYGEDVGTPPEMRRYYQHINLVDNLSGRMTPEQQEQQRLLQQERERQEIDARLRATTLLLEHLTPSQKQTWREYHWVKVRGSKSGRVYRIRRGTSMNIDCLASRSTYCAAPANANETPIEDVVLAQLLWLGADEDGFLRAANRTTYMGPVWDDTSDPPPTPPARTAPTCEARGCEVRVETGPGGARTIYHNGVMAMRVSELARGFSQREIRRLLQGLHRTGRSSSAR